MFNDTKTRHDRLARKEDDSFLKASLITLAVFILGYPALVFLMLMTN